MMAHRRCLPMAALLKPSQPEIGFNEALDQPADFYSIPDGSSRPTVRSLLDGWVNGEVDECTRPEANREPGSQRIVAPQVCRRDRRDDPMKGPEYPYRFLLHLPATFVPRREPLPS
jgi:hypothetical protein